MKLRILDISAIVLSLLVIGGFSVAAYSGRTASRDVVIESSGTRWIYPLDTNRTERIPGPRGDTIIVIKDGTAFVQDSPCPDKLCVHMPAISQPGQWIACLPNRVFVRVKGGNVADVDQLSY